MKAFERLPRSCRSGGTDVGKAGGTPGEVVMLTWLARVYSGSSSGMQADQSPRIRRALEVAIVCKAVPSHSGFLWLWQTSTSSRSSSRQPAASAQSTRGRQVSEGARVVEVGRGWGASERVSSVKLWAQGCALGMPSKCFTPIIASNIQLFIPIHAHFIRSKQILLTTLRRLRARHKTKDSGHFPVAFFFGMGSVRKSALPVTAQRCTPSTTPATSLGISECHGEPPGQGHIACACHQLPVDPGPRA